ncbi:MAG TPA: ester cyclase [Ktedonobacteraceae bacterium]
MQEEHSIPQMVEDVRAGKMQRRKFVKILSGMGISAAGVSAIAAVTSRSFSSKSNAPINSHESPDIHVQLHEQHITNQSQGNTDALQNDYAEHAVVEDSMYDEPFVGRAAIMARKGVGMAAILDLKIKITNRLVHANQVSAEWVATGTHTGDLPGMPATGRPFTLRGVTVSVRQDGKIVRESLYYDVNDLYRQIGPGAK